MMKKLIYSLVILFVPLVFACTSEDSLKPLPELGNPPFELPRGEAGSVEEQIYSVYEKYGSFVLYDFDRTEFYTTWNSRTVYWYAPVKEANKNYVGQMVTFMLEDVFASYPEAFIAKFLPKKIYLVDSVCNSSTYNRSNLVTTLNLNNHGMAVSHVGSGMDQFGDSDWEKVRSGIVTGIMGTIYDSMDVPAEFFSLVSYQFIYQYDEEEDADPEGEFDAYHYVLYSHGLVGSDHYPDYGYFMPHKDGADLGDYLSFLMSTPKTEMDRIFARFDIVKQRAFLIAKFIVKQMEMDPIALQNSFCPNDPLPVGYFD
ncbi:hypothetical protein AALK14_06425 [Butyricimonas hominis]|uniref:hypothetical protein n=1 Tax=Butyricimonas TaxID=574697 RepID=UPI0035145695